jgi:PEP-CTERM motif
MWRLIFAGCLLFASLAQAGTVYTNNPAWDGTTFGEFWGNAGTTPTIGETITVPTNGDSVLNSFSFEVFGAAQPLSFRAYIQSWSGTATTGAPVYVSGTAQTLTSAGANAYTFSPNVTLTAGGTYILYFSILGVTNSFGSLHTWGLTPADSYAGGTFYYSNQDSGAPDTGSVSDLNGATWGTFSNNQDLAFSASFSSTATPEPGTIGLVLVGLSAMAARRRRR